MNVITDRYWGLDFTTEETPSAINIGTKSKLCPICDEGGFKALGTEKPFDQNAPLGGVKDSADTAIVDANLEGAGKTNTEAAGVGAADNPSTEAAGGTVKPEQEPSEIQLIGVLGVILVSLGVFAFVVKKLLE